MRSSRWQAHGNVYLVCEGELDPAQARALAAGTDGIVQVSEQGPDWVAVTIWNPDGSQAEMSGNGTRIAARWLADRTGARAVTVRVGGRQVTARLLDGGLIEQDLGEVVVGSPEVVEGVRFTPVEVGNPHAVVEGDPAELPRIGPLLETHPRFPARTNVQVARRLDADRIEARVWERGVGETDASGSSAVAIVAALGGGSASVRFPGGELRASVSGGRARLIGRAEPVEPGSGGPG